MSKQQLKTTPEAPDPWYRRRRTWNFVVLLLGVAVAAFLFTPERRPQATNSPGAGGPSAGDDLFQNATAMLNRLEQINTTDVMAQVVGGYNHWLEDQGGGAGWQPDPLVATVPPKHVAQLAPEYLAATTMPPADSGYLEEAVSLRDIAKMARGDLIDDVARATRLFDWTVRNLQLDPPPSGRPEEDELRTFQPRRILMQGHADALQRAWIFILLARQQQLDVVMLAVGDPRQPDSLRTWAPALLSGGDLYVFDAELGMPIPGPDGHGVATLAQLAADDSLLRRLDLDAEHRYPLEAGDLVRVVAFVESRPISLTRRMQLVEAKLAGDQKISLAASPSRVAALLKACPQIAEARLWPFPFEEAALENRINRSPRPEALAAMRAWNLPFQVQPMLVLGRKYHFKGNFTGENDELGEQSANGYYQACRLGPEEIELRVKTHAEEALSGDSAPAGREIQTQAAVALLRDGFQRAMQCATYWLGIIAYERGRYSTAIDYFKVRTLEEAPKSFFAPGARYQLARCYEATGEVEQAIALYNEDDSPQRYGNLLRARWLEERADPKPIAE